MTHQQGLMTTDGQPSTPSVAIIGMAGRFPGAASVAELWANLLAGVESITRFAADRVRNPGDAEQVNARGVLAGAELFDAGFFGINPREAELMDPQHRLLLECAWEALEDAGCDPQRYHGAIGVYAGQSFPTYLLANLSGDRGFLERLTCDYQVGNYPTVLGNDKDYLATRVSYKLGLTGPSMTVQTACSTSLVAISQAAQSLLAYQCDVALAGGVSVTFPQERGYQYQEGGMVSGDGHCRTFDADAQGTVFGSGVALVVLKRLEDAVAEGDHIVAVIRGTALNNDGAQKIGYMAPSVDRQAEVVALAHALSGISADTIGYVEAHGTATPLGDPIEIEALTRAFRATTSACGYCAIGSVKTNLGHLEVASGVTGLIKAALAVNSGVIPASLHFRQPNPKIDFAKTPFLVAAARSPWPMISGPRRAGVSSFGVGGTNAHAVLEQPPAIVTTPSSGPQVLVLTARTSAALNVARERLASHLEGNPTLSLSDVAWTLQTGRRHFAHRCVVIAADHATAIAGLRDASGTGRISAECTTTDTPVAFLFPGQGSQKSGMGAELARHEPSFRAALDDCMNAAHAVCPDLREVLFNPTRSAELTQTRYTQPALFAISYATAQCWLARGVRPAAMIGHSVGEYVAACLAGVMPLTVAMRAVAIRGALVQALPGGAMLAVRLAEAELLPLLVDRPLSLAASNGPTSCVVAGSVAAIAEFEQVLSARTIAARHLTTSHAFHSAMMDGMLVEFAEHLRGVSLNTPSIPFISGITGTWITTAQAIDPTYWVRHVREPVRFAAGIATLAADSRLGLLEVGPGRTLTGLARQCLAGGDRRLVTASLPTTGDPDSSGDVAEVAEASGRLWLAGLDVDWSALHPVRPQRVSLPTYPFERSRYWVEPPAIGAASVFAPAATVNNETVTIPTTTITVTPAADRRSVITLALRELVSEQSGTDHRATNGAISFIELGFDSLFLTQFALTLQQRFKIKISFRHLLDELGTIERLAEHLERNAPASAFTSLTAPVAPTSVAPVSTGDATLDAMQRQLADLARQMAQISAAGVPAAPSGMGTPTAAPTSAGEFKAFGPFKPITRGPSGGLNERQNRCLDHIISRYTQRTKESKRQAQHHRSYLADPRVVAGFRQQWKEMVYPLVSVRSKGARLWDIDGNEYIDILNGFGSSLFGHSPDFVNAAVSKQLNEGIEVGPQTPLAGEVAKLICEFTGLERATFCNTGSEAVMAAMRLARTVTGRQTIVSFQGDYHGTFDEVLVRPNHRGSDLRSAPIAPGIPQGKVDNIIILEYGSSQALEIIRARADELAAVLIEPVQSRHPDLQPKGFLHEIRRITAASGTAMIMDEVITGFRVHPRGAQGVFGVQADLATYGKVLGGGHPLGVLAGSARFMDALDGGQWCFGDDSFPEVGVTFFAGTFVRHPLAMAAAKACLVHLKEQGPALQEALNRRTTRLVDALNGLFQQYGVPSTVQRFGSVFYFAFAPEHRLLSLLHYTLRLRGIHIWEGFPCFLTTAHGDGEIDTFIRAVEGSLQELTDGGFLPATGATPPLIATKIVSESAPVAVAPSAAQPTPNDDISGIVIPLAEQLPLTEVQRELWVASQLSPEASVAFNDGVLLHLTGPLDHERLRQALQQVVDRHPALRSRFDANGDCQRFVTQVTVDLPLVEFSGDDSQQCLEQHRIKFTATPFDLTRAPLLRASLVRLGSERHVLMLLAHHLVCDGWSFAVVLNELGQYYSAISLERQVSLPAMVPYHEYASWQSAQISGISGRAAVAFWRKQFRQPPPDLDLPIDHPRRPARTFTGATERLVIDDALALGMRQLSSRLGATPLSGFLGVFAALLARLTQQDDLVIGIPAAGQSLMGVDRLAGHCVHFLPLRLGVTGDLEFNSLVRRVRDTVLDAHEHAQMSYGQLLDALKLPRDPSRPPLLSALFNLDRAGFKDLAFTNLTTTVELNAKAGVIFDLDFNLMETDQGLMLCCHYNRDLFLPQTIRRWLGHYILLAGDAIRRPHVAVGSLEIMNAEERRAVVEGFNQTKRPYPCDSTIAERFVQIANHSPHALAIIGSHGSVTYEKLLQQARVIAGHLAEHVRAPGTPVAICLPKGPDLIAGILGILMAGGAYLPLDPILPRERLLLMLDSCDVAAVVTTSALAKRLPLEGRAVVTPDASEKATNPPVTTASAGDAAYVLFTSGSTGIPKAVEVPHRAVMRLVIETDVGEFDEHTTMLLLAPISFDASTLELWAPLLNGGQLVITDDHMPSLSELGEAIKFYRVNTLWLTAGLFQQVADVALEILTPLRHLLAGGDVLPPAACAAVLKRHPHLRLSNGYGPTENTTFTTCHDVVLADCVGPIPIGRPIANTTVYVLDSRLEPMPVGVVGELFTGGDGLALGYRAQPALTTERFIPDPFTSVGRLYSTGDLARWRPDGIIEYVGRRDGQVKLRGYRIEVGEIEAVLERHPGIRRAVVAIRGSEAAKRLIAWAIVEPGINEQELLAHCAAYLPSYMVPAVLIQVDHFPLGPTGKVNRSALPESDHSAKALSARHAAAGTPSLSIHFQLVQLWEDLLEIRNIRIDDDFFVIGGNSLLAFRMMTEIERQFGSRLSMSVLFAHTTIAKLTNAILAQGPACERPISEIQSGSGDLRPIFFLHGDHLGGGYYCVSLSRHLGAEIPFYALSPLPIDVSRALPSTEELAAKYIQEMRALCPAGPYLLGGFCIGGVIAVEMARQLIAQGHQVNMLVLVDAEGGYRIERFARILLSGVALLTNMSPVNQLARFARINQRIERLRELSPAGLWDLVLRKLGLRASNQTPRSNSMSSRLHAVSVATTAAYEQMNAHLWSARGYRPKPLNLSAHLLVSDEQAAVARDPTLGWAKVLTKVSITRMSGNHLESITRNLPRLAEMLRPLIKRASTPSGSTVPALTPTKITAELSQS